MNTPTSAKASLPWSDKAARVTDEQVSAIIVGMVRDGFVLTEMEQYVADKAIRRALESIAPDAEPVGPTVAWRWRNKRSTDTAWRYGPELPRDFNYGYWECEPLTNAAPPPVAAPDAEPVAWPLRARVWARASTNEKVLEIEGTINDTFMCCRHTEPMDTPDEDVPGLPSLYAAPLPAKDAVGEAILDIANDFDVLCHDMLHFIAGTKPEGADTIVADKLAFRWDRLRRRVQPFRAASSSPKDAVGEAKTFEDGLKAAAAWVAKRRDAYIEEHGSYDYSTGVTEFPGNGDETVCEWDEIEEGILALAASSPPKDAQPSLSQPKNWWDGKGYPLCAKCQRPQTEHWDFPNVCDGYEFPKDAQAVAKEGQSDE